MDNKFSIQNRFLKEWNGAANIAHFYGFQPIAPPEVKKQDLDGTKHFASELHPEDLSALLRMYFDEKGSALPQPLMCWMERPFKGAGEKKRASRVECALVSLGSSKTITDCLVMRTGLSILEALGYKDIELHLNSVGDKESVAEFERKVSTFVKKNFNAFPSELRQALKKDIFTLVREVKSDWQIFQAECPKSIDFLSEASRNHFKEVLEFLEVMDINYVIDHSLVGDPHFGSETIFSFVSEKTGKEPLGLGTRVNRLSKRLGHKKEVPSVVLNISAKLKKPLRKVRSKSAPSDFYLIQFGPEAKIKSLLVLEELRKAGRTVAHSIAKDKLGSQIGIAENSGAGYIILLGQKEALENSVLLRNNTTRAQELIPIPDLAERVRKL